MRRRLRRHHGVPSSRSATRGVGARKGDNWRLSFSTLLPPRRAALYRAMGGVPILLGVVVNGVRAAATQPILRWHEMRKAAGGGVRGGIVRCQPSFWLPQAPLERTLCGRPFLPQAFAIPYDQSGRYKACLGAEAHAGSLRA